MQQPAQKHTIIVSANTLTTQITSTNHLLNLIPFQTNFHLIPPITSKRTSSICSWKTIQQIIHSKASKNKILDITMPFLNFNQKSPNLTRFIFVDGNLIGIRPYIRTSQDRKRYEKLNLKQVIKNLEKDSRCPIGEFCLELSNVKIAFVFESEVELFPNILEDYAKQGCQIFSIVYDLPFDPDCKKSVRNKIKCFLAKNEKIAICSSMLYSLSKKLTYNGGSFVFDGKETKVESHVSIYDQSETIVSQINFTKTQKYSSHQIKQKNKIHRVRVTHTLKSQYIITQKPCVKKFEFDPSKIHLYNLWYHFSTLNNRSPFIISTKTPTDLKIIYQLQKLSHDVVKNRNSLQSSDQILKNLLIIYNYTEVFLEDKLKEIILTIDENYIDVRPTVETSGLEGVMNMCSKRFHKLCFYTNDQSEMDMLNLSKSKFPHSNMQIQNHVDVEKQNAEDIGRQLNNFYIISESDEEEQKDITVSLEISVSQEQPLSSQNSNEISQSMVLTPQIQSITDKVKLAQEFKKLEKDICHSCLNSFLKFDELTVKCSCSLCFCVDCLHTYGIRSVSLNSNCPVCLNKCACNNCTNKGNNPYGIFAENIINTESQSQSKSSKYFGSFKGCHKCQQKSFLNIIKVKIQPSILFQCSSKQCFIQFCYNCVKEKQKNNHCLNYLWSQDLRNWICYCCRNNCDCNLCRFQREERQFLKEKEEERIKLAMIQEEMSKEMVIESNNILYQKHIEEIRRHSCEDSNSEFTFRPADEYCERGGETEMMIQQQTVVQRQTQKEVLQQQQAQVMMQEQGSCYNDRSFSRQRSREYKNNRQPQQNPSSKSKKTFFKREQDIQAFANHCLQYQPAHNYKFKNRNQFFIPSHSHHSKTPHDQRNSSKLKLEHKRIKIQQYQNQFMNALPQVQPHNEPRRFLILQNSQIITNNNNSQMEVENHEAGDIESQTYSNNASSLLFNTRKPNIERDF